MPRPFIYRRINCKPKADYFRPKGIPICLIEEITLTMDEFEAIRLADLEGLYQDKAAEKMKISRQTFGNIINLAHKKIAEAIVKAKALKIQGGAYKMTGLRKFKCHDCNHEWEISYGLGRPNECPQCKNTNINYAHTGRSGGFRRGKGS
jgi:predicted DNA-binding protein (UPF0251 family)